MRVEYTKAHIACCPFWMVNATLGALMVRLMPSSRVSTEVSLMSYTWRRGAAWQRP